MDGVRTASRVVLGSNDGRFLCNVPLLEKDAKDLLISYGITTRIKYRALQEPLISWPQSVETRLYVAGGRNRLATTNFIFPRQIYR